MSDQVVPETENLSVAQAAIAWEIARLVINSMRQADSESVKVTLINTYIEAFKAIQEAQPIKKG